MNDDVRDLLTRHGHLGELTLDLYDAGELSPVQRERVEEHLQDCGQCRRHLRAVEEHVVSIAPPLRVAPRPSAGSVTLWGLAVSGGLGLAAAAVLALTTVPWPGPQRVQPEPRESSPPMASAYTTSTAQECDLDEFVGVGLEVKGQWIEVQSRGEGYLAVLVATGSDSVAMDTDGEDADEVLEVLRAPAFVGDGEGLRLRLGVGSHRVVALMCSQAFAVEDGDPLVAGPGCRRYEIEEHFGPEQRDS